MSFFLSTRRLGFRRWRESDLPLALGLWGDPRVTRLFHAGGAMSEEQVRARLLAEIAHHREHAVQYWPVFTRADGRHVGCCGLRPRPQEPDCLELGFHIRADLWRRGYALEAALAVVDLAFDGLTVTSLFAGHHPENGASRALLARLGFVHSHDEFYAPTGLEHPSYRLTREAWRGAAGGP